MRYSVKEACQALQVSDRTLRRAIKTGDLPAQREPWGGGERLTLDPGDLAAWAQAAGRPMIPLDNEDRQGSATIGKTSAEDRHGSAPIGSVPMVATPATSAEDRQTSATSGKGGGQGSAPIGTVPIPATPAEVDTLKRTVQALEVERDFLRRVLDNVTKALPAGNTGVEEADRWRDYAEELERWHSLGWWARRRQRRPEPPKRGETPA